MNKQLLFITIVIISLYSGAQGAANGHKERALAEIAALRTEIAQKSVAELEAEAAEIQARFESSATYQQCSVLHARNCEISEMFLKRNYANEAAKANLVAEVQRNLVRMDNYLSPRDNFELSARMVRISERLSELHKAQIATESEEVI